MPRLPLLISQSYPYHVTARVNNRDSFPLHLPRVWKELTHCLYTANILFAAQTHALVLMPNHFHLIVSCPREDLGRVMMHIMRDLTKKLNSLTFRSGHVFGGPYYRSLIHEPLYFAHALKYVYRNPVKARLVHSPEEWPFSTLVRESGYGGVALPLYYPFGKTRYVFVPNSESEFRTWISRPFRNESEEFIKRALRKREFTLPALLKSAVVRELRSELA